MACFQPFHLDMCAGIWNLNFVFLCLCVHVFPNFVIHVCFVHLILRINSVKIQDVLFTKHCFHKVLYRV